MPAKKRRDDGEGSVYRMGDGRWRAEVTVGWERLPDGKTKRVRRYVYGHTEAEAKLARRDLLNAREAGQLPIGDQVTVGAWVTYWLDEIAVHRVKVKTVESYRTLINHWIVPTIGDVRLRALQPEHVERLQAAMRVGRGYTRKNGTDVLARPLAASSVLQAHRILSRALKVAYQRGKVTRNVATLVDAPSVAGRRAEHFLDVEQAKAVLQAAEGRWNGARWSVGLAIGLRQGEALGLIWDVDVDLDAGVLNVNRQLQRRRGGTLELVPYPKSKAGQRSIALADRLVRALQVHRGEQQANRAALPDWTGTELGDLVFTQRNGRPVEPRSDWAEWRELLAQAGAPLIRQHGSRHTAATLMLLQGIDVKVVSAILGHGSSTITRDLYQHVVPELARDAAERVGSALWGD